MKSIIMNDFSVQRILSGAKTQTRRVVKLRNLPNSEIASIHRDGAGFGWIAWSPKPVSAEETARIYPGPSGFPCPYGKVGDHLWVRETWRIESFLEGEPVWFGYRADGDVAIEDSTDDPRYEAWWERIAVQSTDELIKMNWPRKDADDVFHWNHKCSPLRWRPSIFMPRWASRITLKITDIRVERVQEISGEDCVNEGATTLTDLNMMLSKKDKTPFHEQNNRKARAIFQALWDSINSKKGYSWNDNPWVWCISFKVVDKL